MPRVPELLCFRSCHIIGNILSYIFGAKAKTLARKYYSRLASMYFTHSAAEHIVLEMLRASGYVERDLSRKWFLTASGWSSCLNVKVASDPVQVFEVLDLFYIYD